jgi:hypothetical protein
MLKILLKIAFAGLFLLVTFVVPILLPEVPCEMVRPFKAK